MSASEDIPCHHKKAEVCFTRPEYRAPNKPNAVKVYTVSQESLYLIIQHVPAINLGPELAKLLNNSGTLIKFEKINDYPCEEFTEAYLCKYTTLASARYIKKKYDDHSFYGSQLHLTYAPEQESADETCQKLDAYRKSFCKVLNSLSSQQNTSALRNSFKRNSADYKALHSDSIRFQNNELRYKDLSVGTRHPSYSFLQSSISETATNSCELHIPRISLPTNCNSTTSNPPTQQLFCKTSDFRPVPRQVKIRQSGAERHVGKQKRGGNETVKHIGVPSSKNLLISSELLNRTGESNSAKDNSNRAHNSCTAEQSKEVKIKKRRRI
ncbi:RNA-binding protein 48-like [Bolinopsis microptera]|uniref:RNA-binding protein 48-like n=1 Tax=Bolinopsis microptera TaxID=2820187 RepID=UPI00307A8A82